MKYDKITKITSKIIMTIMFVMLLMNISLVDSYAYYSIGSLDINAKLEDNGDLIVKENYLYQTNEYSNGVYRQYDCNYRGVTENEKLDFKLVKVSLDGEEIAQAKEKPNIGDDKVFEYNIVDDKVYEIRVFHPFNGMNFEVTYEYILKNFALKYNDIVDLHWNFIPGGIEEEIEKCNFKFTVPEEASEGRINVFLHGNGEPVINRVDNVTDITLGRNRPGNIVTYRSFIESKYLPDAKAFLNKDMYDEVMQQEEKIIRDNKLKLEKQRARQERIKAIAQVYKKYESPISIVIFIITVIVCILYYTKNRYIRRIGLAEKYCFDIPEEDSVVRLINYYRGYASYDQFKLFFLELIRKGVIKLTKQFNEKGKEVEFISYSSDMVEKLDKFEKRVFTELLKKNFGDTNEIEYKKYIKKVSKDYSFAEKFAKIEKDFNDDNKTKYGKLEIIGLVPCLLYVLFHFIILSLPYIHEILIGNHPEAIVLLIFYNILSWIIGIFFMQSNRNSLKARIAVIMIATPILVIIAYNLLSYSNVLLLASALITAIFFVWGISVVKYTDEQQRLVDQLEGLKNYIRDFSLLEEKGLEHMILWEKYLVLAVGFGLNSKIKDDIGKAICNYQDSMNTNLTTHLILYNGSINKLMDISTQVSYASMSSSGANSSFGGGGGSMGGSSGRF